MLIDNAIKTHEQVSREMSGGDWEENDGYWRENRLLTQARRTAQGHRCIGIAEKGDGDED